MIDVEMLRPTADEMLSGLKADAAMRGRICFKAAALEKLPEIADEMLSGLSASSALRHRILLAAQRKKIASEPVFTWTRKKPAYARLIPAAGMALTMALMVWFGYLYGGGPNPVLPAPPMVQSGIRTYAAGGAGAEVPQYQSLFAGEGVNPPLIAINGRFYRMLNTPASLPASLCAEQQFTSVSFFTEEPSLADPVGVISNVAQEGAPVYSVRGISFQTVCAAEVNGVLRLFQRVGYASSAMIGNEMFEDTFGVQGMVQSLELSGVGIIDDPAVANELVSMIGEFAEFHSNEMEAGSQTLTVRLNNGLALTLIVQDDLLSGCGVWACPEFFEEFLARFSS